MSDIFWKISIFIVSLLLTLMFIHMARATDRCVAYVQTVRVEHTKQFGIEFPYWYGVGQLKQESACRSNVTAFDAGQGIAQFMPKTAKYITALMGENLNPYNPKQGIRMQAFYMARIHHKENWTDMLWVTYQIYNGGGPALAGESRRAGMTDWNTMRSVCQRKKIQMKWGILDLCEVNYSYSKNIKRFGELYRRGADGMRYGL